MAIIPGPGFRPSLAESSDRDVIDLSKYKQGHAVGRNKPGILFTAKVFITRYLKKQGAGQAQRFRQTFRSDGYFIFRIRNRVESSVYNRPA